MTRLSSTSNHRGGAKLAIALAIGIGTGLVTGWWLWGRGEAAPASEPRQVKTETVRRGSPPRPAAPEAPFEPAAPPLPAGPPSAHQQALDVVAEYTGDGVVRCSVGDALPEGPVAGISRGWVEDGVLVGAVEEATGTARIQFPADAKSDPPRLVIRWHGVAPGEQGTCDTLRPQRVAVTGRVVDALGQPVTGAEVGNLVDGTAPVGPDGRFVAACWRGAECPLAARASVGSGWGPFVTLVPDGPTTDVELVLDAAPPTENMRTYLEAWVAEDERLEGQPDPLALALADTRLSPDGRALVEAWMEEQLDQRKLVRTALADVSVALR